MFFCFFVCSSMKQVLKFGQARSIYEDGKERLSCLNFVPDRRKKKKFLIRATILIICTGLRPRNESTWNSAGYLFVLCSQTKLSDRWKRYSNLLLHCKKKKKQKKQNIIFSVNTLITDIINAPMTLLLPALLLTHLFNPERYCPYVALRSLKNPSFGNHLLLWGHCTS